MHVTVTWTLNLRVFVFGRAENGGVSAESAFDNSFSKIFDKSVVELFSFPHPPLPVHRHVSSIPDGVPRIMLTPILWDQFDFLLE